MDEVFKEFVVESTENLDQLDRDFVALEKDPGNRELLSRIFRSVHTIKGTCGFFGLSKLESVTHVGENLLSRLRDGQLSLTPERISALLSLVDAIREMIGRIEATESEGDGDYTDLIKLLTQLQQPESTSPSSQPTAAPRVEVAPPATSPLEEKLPSSSLTETQGTTPVASAPSVPAPVFSAMPAAPAPAQASAIAANPAKEKESVSSLASESAIRVDVGILDKLMNLVGELVLARNRILQFTSLQEDSTFLAASQRLNIITSELQEGVMKTRMQPIDNIWNKFPRVVRDLANICGKKIQIQMEGKETELDKTLIEAIKDPLTHLVRNAVDHGIESPTERRAAGKSEEGVLLLKAYHEGGQVNIEISDDGKGIPVDRIREKALAKGMVTPEKANRMSDREVLNLIFMPGLSTAEKVSNISGRGVGMDVVKTNIEKIGGVVDIQSKLGFGTTMKIKIPLTLAIIPSLIVTTGGDLYAIPQVSLLELVMVESQDVGKKIERIQGAEVYRLRGKLLPLVRLNRELSLNLSQEGEGERPINIVILQADDRQFGLIVDEINDTQEIVVKPLGQQLKGISAFAGATILGDGRLALILDVMGIAQKSGVVAELHERALHDMSQKAENQAGDHRQMLLFEGPDRGRMALLLSEVDRLEKFSLEMVEKTGDTEVVQYRNKIMPLIRLSSALPERRKTPRHEDASNSSRLLDSVEAVVCTRGDKTYGIVVGQILDILEASVDHLGEASRKGIAGTMVIQGKVTELLDIQQVIDLAESHNFKDSDSLNESLGALLASLNREKDQEKRIV